MSRFEKCTDPTKFLICSDVQTYSHVQTAYTRKICSTQLGLIHMIHVSRFFLSETGIAAKIKFINAFAGVSDAPQKVSRQMSTLLTYLSDTKCPFAGNFAGIYAMNYLWNADELPPRSEWTDKETQEETQKQRSLAFRLHTYALTE